MLKLIKKGDKYWLFEDSQIGLFSPSKFTINLELNDIVIVYENGLKSKRYNVSDCEIYDLGELTPFTTSSGDLFMQKLEELNCPCFQKNENTFNIIGGAWGDITGNLSNQTDLQTALDSKHDKVTTPSSVYTTDAGGLQVMKPISEFGLTQKTITTSRTALATDNGRLIKIKGNATYTIDQSTLPTDWNVIVRSFTGATCTFVASVGTTFDAPTGLILKPLKMCSIIKDSDDNKILINGETSLT